MSKIDKLSREYKERLNKGFLLNGFVADTMVITLHFTDRDRALEIAEELKSRRLYTKITLLDVEKPWLEEEV